jgi:hypothetical protein
METVFASLSDVDLTAIVDDINSQGFGVATNCIRPEHLAPLRAFIEHRVSDAGGQYVGFTGADAMRDTFLARLASSPEFVRACKAIYEKGTGKSAPDQPFYQVLRCLSGNTGEKHAFIFHYDSYVLTALVPIIMPAQGRLGDLIMLPNSRRFRKSYARNLIDKVLLDNALAQTLLKRFISSGRLKATKVRMSPGNIYFFWGCRSIHANEPCDPDKIRATALFHYVDPHADSWLRGALHRKATPKLVPVGQ